MTTTTSQAIVMKLANSCLKVVFFSMKSETNFFLTEMPQC